MHRLLVCLLGLLVVGCSTPEKLRLDIARSGYGIETYKDQNIVGRYRAACAYDPKAIKVSVSELQWMTMLDGVKAAKHDGYDLVTWGGPTPAKLTVTTSYRYGPTTTTENPGFIYSIQGFKSSDPNRKSNAGTADSLISEITQQLARFKH